MKPPLTVGQEVLRRTTRRMFMRTFRKEVFLETPLFWLLTQPLEEFVKGNEKAIERAAPRLVRLCLMGYRKATKLLTPGLKVTACRRHKARKNSTSVELLLTIGKPNFAERKFIRDCQKAGEKFPIRKVRVSR